MSHESETHHKNWSRRTLDPLLTLAASWLGHREQDKSHVCPLLMSHQDTNLELQMVLYRLLPGTKTKMYLSPWLKTPKEEKSWCLTLSPGCYQRLHRRSYFCTPVVSAKSYFYTPETVPQNKPEEIPCYTSSEFLSWGRAFCRPGVPSRKAANIFLLICKRAGLPHSDPAIFRWPRATRYMLTGLWPWLPDRPQHFLGELAVTPCKNWAGFYLHSWVSGSPAPACPMAGTVREPQQVNWTWFARELHRAQELQTCCIRSTESEARKCQVSMMSHFT